MSSFASFDTNLEEPQFAEVPGPDEDLVQLLTPSGSRVSHPTLDPWITDIGSSELLSLYEDLVVVRRIDTEATALQRQGQLGLWPPLLGQEAAQIGSARALRRDDFVFTSYRENAVAYCRGVSLGDLATVWRGNAHTGWNPYEVGMATPSVIIGAQTLHATGYAMGCVKDGVDSVAIAYFGDGATSQGDVNEAMIFAASFHAPVIFFCQNNQWAISEPVGLQAVRALADRSPGFGIPSMRVDGNDVLAVLAATRIALNRARTGGGPTFIEAVTYRMGPHTTSDDPTRYENLQVRSEWASKDPLVRVERYLERMGVLDDEARASIAQKSNDTAARLRQAVVGFEDPEPLSLFDNVYSEPHSGLDRQKQQYAAYLSYIEGSVR
ncbi:MAG TPA: pyruvate dehydrogenase (acetyl-transferring) E1 component subunit alpha [Galbitalea sp.]|jgi:pyruvate dehydrogenase E1 component alpha subunit